MKRFDENFQFLMKNSEHLHLLFLIFLKSTHHKTPKNVQNKDSKQLNWEESSELIDLSICVFPNRCASEPLPVPCVDVICSWCAGRWSDGPCRGGRHQAPRSDSDRTRPQPGQALPKPLDPISAPPRPADTRPFRFPPPPLPLVSQAGESGGAGCGSARLGAVAVCGCGTL